MDLNRLFRRLVLGQVMLSVGAFCLAEGNLGLLLIAGGLAALAWVVVERRGGRGLPPWVILVGSLAAVAVLLLELSASGGTHLVPAVGHFTVLLQLVQLYARKTHRDFALLLALSLLQIIAASMLSDSLLFALVLGAYGLTAVVVAVTFQMKAAAEQVQAAEQAAAPSDAPMEPRPAPWGPGFGRHLRRTVLALLVLVALVALVAYAAVPRDTGGRPWPGWSDAAAVGLERRMHLGAPPQRGTSRPVLHLRIGQRGAPLVSPPESLLYLRGVVLDEYLPLTRQWVRSPDAGQRDLLTALPAEGLWLAPAPADEALAELTVTPRTPRVREFLLPPGAVFLQAPEVPAAMIGALDRQARPQQEAAAVQFYRTRAPLAPDARPLESAPPGLADGRLRGYARGWPVQTDLRRVSDLAAGVLAAARLDAAGDDPAADASDQRRRAAEALTDHLRQRCAYALEFDPAPPGVDPTLHFLFDARRGHCELFASGLAVLARSIGLRARVVVGYLAGEFNAVGGYWVVRQSDAHAWTEIDCGRWGWLTFDATPAADVATEHAAARGGWGWPSDLWHHLEFAWGQALAALDDAVRGAFAGLLRSGLWEGLLSEKGWLGRRWAQGCGAFGMVRDDPLLLALTLSLALLAAWTLRAAWRLGRRRHTGHGQRPAPGGGDAPNEVLACYQAMAALLAEHGHRRADWQSPLAFAGDLARADPVRMAGVLSLTQAYYRHRFGGGTGDGPVPGALRLQLARLEQALRRRGEIAEQGRQ